MGRPVTTTVEGIAGLDRCGRRIAALSAISDGWHDGGGNAPTHLAVTAALCFLAGNRPLAEHFSIFPTDAGGVLFEFVKEGWDYSVEFWPDGRMETYGVEIDGEGETDALECEAV